MDTSTLHYRYFIPLLIPMLVEQVMHFSFSKHGSPIAHKSVNRFDEA